MPKNIVVCCDGTWNRFDRGENTNIVHIAACATHHSSDQVLFYDPGVGTIASAQWHTGLFKAISKVLGGALGFGLGRNIEEAYLFLMAHYEPGDSIYLFGFSRGAYTVRAIAAMLKFFGLLERQTDNLFPYCHEIVKAHVDGKPAFELGARFRRNFSRSIEIHFIGVFDTVSSVGWLTSPLKLPWTRCNSIVKHVRHAVAIDERRKSFRQNLMQKASDQDFKEVWFAGVHSDVGGGYPDAESGLSKVALKWMLREAELCGLRLDKGREKRILGGSGESPYSKPDCLARMHDPFQSSLLWRLAQWVPRKSFRMSDHVPVGYWDMSPARRPRPMDGLCVLHQSVLDRWAGDAGYRPENVPVPSAHPVDGW